MIAALFVDGKGVYSNIEGVDAWGIERDARLYSGPYPVVAHPPCPRWGRSANGGSAARVAQVPGIDGGCFAAALVAVRRFGGVLEHPAGSLAWREFGLLAPPSAGGWVVADAFGGFTCQVEQGHYGHRAQKRTWLYACGVELPSLIWGSSFDKVRVGRYAIDPTWPPERISRARRTGNLAAAVEESARGDADRVSRPVAQHRARYSAAAGRMTITTRSRKSVNDFTMEDMT